jgi:hypothetical protein
VADTTYIVLKHITDAPMPDESPIAYWAIEGDAGSASSAEAAIRKIVKDGGTYVAVPARSWKPVQVRTETQTVIRLDTPPAE